MNTKFAVAVLFALVSVSLCEIPPPSQELVDKYENLKNTFYKRLLNTYAKLQEAAGPMVESAGNTERGQAAKEFVEDMQSRPELKAIVRVASGMAVDAAPLVDKARATVLGAYEHYLRPHVGEQLSNAIDQLKVYLNEYMPAE